MKDFGKKYVALLDVDGVLADFLSPVIESMNKLIGVNIKSEDVTTWRIEDMYKKHDPDAANIISDIIQQPGFCESLKMFPGADEFVYGLSEKFDVYFVTSPWDSPTWVTERNIWISSHFGEEHVRKTVYTENKHLVKGDVLIDDRYENCLHWQEAFPKSTSVLWTRPYNIQYKPPGFRMKPDFKFALASINYLLWQ